MPVPEDALEGAREVERARKGARKGEGEELKEGVKAEGEGKEKRGGPPGWLKGLLGWID